MFCQKCGTQLSDGATFCHKCGAKLTAEVAPQAAPVQAAPQVAPQAAPVQVMPPQKKSKKKFFIIGGIILAVIISSLTPISSVVTRITLEKATSKGGKPYALFNFEAIATLSKDEAAQAKKFGQQFMAYVESANLEPEFAEAS